MLPAGSATPQFFSVLRTMASLSAVAEASFFVMLTMFLYCLFVMIRLLFLFCFFVFELRKSDFRTSLTFAERSLPLNADSMCPC